MIRTLALLLVLAPSLQADLFLPSIFGDHMVLQREKPIKVWGWAEAAEEIAVALAGQEASTQANADGYWELYLPAMPAGGPFTMEVVGGETVTFEDVLIGEVWLCSGQSNMGWSVALSKDADLEVLSANLPQVRHISVPRVASQESLRDFESAWQLSTPESITDFSAVGYFYGKRLHEIINVPIGLIDNAWGGSSAAAWVPREVLLQYPMLRDAVAEHDRRIADYERLLEEGATDLPRRDPRTSQHRPANLYHGVLAPIRGYTIRGTIWYQGEANARHARSYQTLFPLLIQTWRDDWDDDFFFFWAQLADYQAESTEPVVQSNWAELREAQTMTLDVTERTGQAVIIDLGEGNDIHPRNKQDVARRLLRLALDQVYGFDIASRSPRFASLEAEEGALLIRFDDVGQRLITFDTNDILGFEVAGSDGSFHRAVAEFVGNDEVRVSSSEVPDPAAVRYAWADNPVCNVYSSERLPLTPFRASVQD